MKDIEALQEENRKLKLLISQFKTLLDSIPDPVFMKDEQLRWIYGNPVILNLYSIDKNDYIGKTEDQLLPEEFAESCMESDRKAVAKGTISKSEERARDSDGNMRFYEVFKVPSFDPKTKAFGGLIGVGRDITERKSAQEALEKENAKRKENERELARLNRTLESQVALRTVELERARKEAVELSLTDELTGLNNRRAFFEKSSVIDTNARSKKCTYALLLLDIDRFKQINDGFGHAAGDRVLVKLADTLQKNLRATDIEGRIGGEEFAVTLTDTTLADAKNIAEQIRSVIAKIQIEGLEKIRLRISIGVAAFDASSKTFKAVLSHADEALYRAKASGRNRVCVYEAS